MSERITDPFYQLHHQIEQSFNQDELVGLTFDLGVDFENLAGDTKIRRIWSLIRLLHDQGGRVAELVAVCERERPNETWPTMEWNNIPFYFRAISEDERFRQRHLFVNWDGQTDMRYFDLSGKYDLTGGNRKIGASLLYADLSFSSLRELNMSKADLRYARFYGCDLTEASVSAANAEGSGWRQAILRGASVAGTNFKGADWRGADVREIELYHTCLYGVQIDEETQMDPRVRDMWHVANGRSPRGHKVDHRVSTVPCWNLDEFDLKWMDFRWVSLSRSLIRYADLFGVDFRYADLTLSHFLHSRLQEGNFSHADLTHSKLTDCEVSEAKFIETNLSETDFARARCIRTNFTGANLHKAQMRQANFAQANFTNANLAGAYLPVANLIGANLKTAKNLNEAYLVGAEYDGSTQFPTFFDPKKAKMKKVGGFFSLFG